MTMKYYSTNKTAPKASLEDAVIHGLAPDRGLYMPEEIQKLPAEFFQQLDQLSLQEIAFTVANSLFGQDIEADVLQTIIQETFSFDIPAIEVEDNIYSLELFHGPTLAFKDVGARFMARLLQYFIRRKGQQQINVLVATSGDTGSAVANGFLGVEGIHVYVLYPKGKVSHIQESQFTTLGQNVTAIEINGVFDDCQALVKQAFMDNELNAQLKLTSANSINVARFLPQSFYYFYAYAQLKKLGKANNLVVSVPSGNFGKLCAGLFAQEMGLPIKSFIAANNANDVFFNFLKTGLYHPQPSKQTIANAMDVGNPSNFARIYALYHESYDNIKQHISGATYTDNQIQNSMRQCYETTGYVLDPHGACGYKALKEQLQPNETGLFFETAHPAKFKEKVDEILSTNIAIPQRLAAFMKGKKKCVEMQNDFKTFKHFLMNQEKSRQ